MYTLALYFIYIYIYITGKGSDLLMIPLSIKGLEGVRSTLSLIAGIMLTPQIKVLGGSA